MHFIKASESVTNTFTMYSWWELFYKADYLSHKKSLTDQ